MVRKLPWRGRLLLLGTGLIPILASAGCASDRQGLGNPPPDVTNVAQRPTYQVPGTRPLYLGGYAGAYYGPTRRGGR